MCFCKAEPWILRSLKIEFTDISVTSYSLLIKSSPSLRWICSFRTCQCENREVIHQMHSLTFISLCVDNRDSLEQRPHFTLNENYLCQLADLMTNMRGRETAFLLSLNIEDMTGESSIFLAHTIQLSPGVQVCFGFFCNKTSAFGKQFFNSLAWNQFHLQLLGQPHQPTLLKQTLSLIKIQRDN